MTEPARPVGRPKRRDYSQEDITAGLSALVLMGNRPQAAHRLLKGQGNNIPPSTLRYWAELHHERYQRLRIEMQAQIEREMVPQITESAMMAEQALRAAIQEVIRRLEKSPTKVHDPAAVARNMATAMGINVDKLMALQNRPVIIQVQSGDDVMANLARKFPGLVIDSSADEINTPELTGPES